VPLPADLTEKQLEAIAALKVRIEAACVEKAIEERYAHPVDYDYVRFLRARKWNVEDAFKMMIATLVWRNTNKPDLITEADVESENRKGKVYFQEYDYNGNLIAWIKVRLHKSSDCEFEMMQKLCLYWMEQGFRHIRPDAPGTCVLFDMKGFGIANMDYKYVKFIIDMFANHYPDTLAVCAIVNSPWIFNGCWYIIKPWVDPVTASKVKFVNEKELAQIIPKSSLPTDLGGESTFDWPTSYVPVAERPATSASSAPQVATPAPATSSTPSLSHSESEDASNSESKKKRKKKSSTPSSSPAPATLAEEVVQVQL
jgi:hypothetical protein